MNVHDDTWLHECTYTCISLSVNTSKEQSPTRQFGLYYFKVRNSLSTIRQLTTYTVIPALSAPTGQQLVSTLYYRTNVSPNRAGARHSTSWRIHTHTHTHTTCKRHYTIGCCSASRQHYHMPITASTKLLLSLRQRSLSLASKLLNITSTTTSPDVQYETMSPAHGTKYNDVATYCIKCAHCYQHPNGWTFEYLNFQLLPTQRINFDIFLPTTNRTLN